MDEVKQTEQSEHPFIREKIVLLHMNFKIKEKNDEFRQKSV